MPTPHFARIRSFMQKAGQKTPGAPLIPEADTRLLRAKLILEEALETVKALGVGVRVTTDDGQEVDFNHVDHLDFFPQGAPDLEGVVDGCADISVVTIGTLVAFGVDDEPILEEVDQANLRKFGPGGYARDDGKWMKPPDWTPPDIQGILHRLSASG